MTKRYDIQHKGFAIVNEAQKNTSTSLALSMIKLMLVIIYLVPLPCQKPA